MKVVVALAVLFVLSFAVGQLALPPGQGQPPPSKLKFGSDPSYIQLVVRPSGVDHLLADGQFVYAAYDWTVVKLAKSDLHIVAWRSLREQRPEPKPIARSVVPHGAREMEVREALRDLFRQVNVSYSIAPDVSGRVAVSNESLPFESALRDILRQVGATFWVEGGVFQIITQEAAAMSEPTKIGKMAMDGSDLFVSMGLRVVRLSKKDLSIVFERNIGISPKLSEKSGR